MFSGCLCCKPNDDATTTTYTVEKHANGEVQAVEPTINNRAPSQESNAQDKPPIIEEPTSKPNDKPPPPTQHVVDQCGDKVDAPLSSVASTDIELIIEEAKSISQVGAAVYVLSISDLRESAVTHFLGFFGERFYFANLSINNFIKLNFR